MSRGRNKIGGKWAELVEESEPEEVFMQDTRGKIDARGNADQPDVAETPDMPVIVGTSVSADITVRTPANSALACAHAFGLVSVLQMCFWQNEDFIDSRDRKH